jgi:hypothetical protein
MSAARSLFPRKRTSIRDLAMSQMCHEPTHAPQQNSILTVHCWDICRRVGEAGIAKDMSNKSFGRIAELNVGPDRRRLATTDNWWETVLWLTPSIIKS